MDKVSSTINNVRESVSDFMKDTASSVMDRMSSDRNEGNAGDNRSERVGSDEEE